MSSRQRSPALTRRRFLGATAATGLGASSGCLQRVRSLFNRDSLSTLSVTILSPPSDDDEIASELASRIGSSLEAVGIGVEIQYLPLVELRRQVLINGDFEMFVGRMPPVADPDCLRERLDSVYAEEPGWQNPYSFTDLTLDGFLARQRTTAGEDRERAVDDVVGHIVREQPFVTIGFLQSIRAVRSGKYTGWSRYGPRSPLTYLGLEGEEDLDSLRVSITDSEITRNLNPLSAAYRENDPFLQLLYDPLVYRTEDGTLPWIAETIDWEEGETTRATVTVRPESAWHDGVDLTAGDISFTYRFLKDTSLGELGVAVPSPRFRGRVDLIDSVELVDSETVVLDFGSTSRAVARHGLTVPILPEHRWIDHTDEANVSGFNSVSGTTDALVLSNTEPVGSGPLRFDSVTAGSSLDLRRNEEHFLHANPPESFPDHLRAGFAFERLALRTVPSHQASVEVLRSGTVDATAATLVPTAVPEAVGSTDLSLAVKDGATPYHLGFDTSTGPFSNPYFRRLVARLVDKGHVVEEVFEGYGDPASNPLDPSEWTADAMAFDGTDPEVPFIGTDGEVAVSEAREAFRDRGFNFNEDGKLVRRE